MDKSKADGSRPKVTLPQGTYVGIEERGPYPGTVECFKGIPYAQPPTGERRFRPPQKVLPSSTEHDASQFGPRAPARQFVVFGPKLEESEDCLTANIFRPARAAGESSLLPVALYIHGGAFNRGNAAMHDTAAMVGWSEAPFVGVSFGYRVGALGFLPSKLSAEEGVLNLGLKDQIHMMEWVQENIHHFGGDKNSVTLFGLSAGAHSIGYHLLNYEEGQPPLFHRVLLESGAPTSRAVRLPDSPIHEEQFAAFLREVACPSGLSGAQTLDYLRSLPLATLTAAQTTVFYQYNTSLRWAFQPVIDGEIIRCRPIDSWQQGRWHKVPIMTGFTTNEGSLYVDKSMDSSAAFRGFWKTLLPQLSTADLDTIEALYPDPLAGRSDGSEKGDSESGDAAIYREDRAGVGRMYQRIEAAYAHYAYVAPVRQTAHFASQQVPVYLYQWALPSEDLVNGAKHGDNMFYEMRSPSKCGKSPTQDELSGILHAYVVSFLCTGDPSKLQGRYPARPVWARYEPGSGQVMVFGKKNQELIGGPVGPAAELEPDTWAAKESDFWWSKVPISQQ